MGSFRDRRITERIGTACCQARPERRIAVRTGSADYVRRRHPNSDIFCDDITVSRRHSEFRSQNSQFQVVDVGSLNGTYVNRVPVQSAVLANVDEIQIGKFHLVFLTAPRPNDERR